MFALCLDWNYVGSGGSSIGGMRLIDLKPGFCLSAIQLFLRPCPHWSGKYILQNLCPKKKKRRAVRSGVIARRSPRLLPNTAHSSFCCLPLKECMLTQLLFSLYFGAMLCM